MRILPDMAEAEARVCVWSQRYRNLRYTRQASDCAVRAIAAATGLDYDDVLPVATDYGYQAPGGMALVATLHTLDALGFAARRIARFPGTVREISDYLRNERGGYIVVTADHALGYLDGQCYDFEEESDDLADWLFHIVRRNK